ncbi:MAG TPA: ABC transporter ATP-binding protein [Bauldia sp.]|nr:ABC transporter ATP-binding protein [Bauldia sp.]
MLFAEGIRLAFSDHRGTSFTALDIDTFRPEPGKLTAIAGPSGSGKSTLLYVLAGLQPPQAGRVTADGMDIYSLGESRRDAWRRRTIGFVFQDFHLIPELSLVGNVALPATFGRSPGSRRRASELLVALGVPTDRRSVGMLSRGEQQRVAIARALAFDPPVILADEPTASLDGAAATDVRAILKRLAGEGRTVVVVSHDDAVLSAADATLRLDHGRPTAGFPMAAE